jgi:phosphatidylserine/phosphatidylglycerophosphate/cardiolipin synthase-like enzyme
MKSKSLLKIAILCILVGIIIVTLANRDIKLPTTKAVYEDIPRETSKPIQVYFCLKDDCEQKVTDLIKTSSKVDCAFYDLDLDNIINSLKEKNYRLVIDKENLEDLGTLNYITNTNSHQLTHNKFCILDNKIILTGSFNPTERGNFYNNNNLIIIESQYLVENYNDEFNELYNQQFGSGEKNKNPAIYFNNEILENYFCQEDSCEEKVINILNKAEKSIYFMTFSFTSDQIGDTILNKSSEGIEIKGIFEKTQNNDYNEYHKLTDLNIKWDQNPYNMHHKVFIIDNKTIITGSYNPTSAGDKKNDENILIINNQEVTNKFLEEFNYIWNFNTDLILEEKQANSIIISEVYYDTTGKDAEEEFISIS